MFKKKSLPSATASELKILTAGMPLSQGAALDNSRRAPNEGRPLKRFDSDACEADRLLCPAIKGWTALLRRPILRTKCCASMVVVLLNILLLFTGCRTLPPLPQADLSQADWTVFAGQALFQPNAEAPEIAGELLVATNRNGAAFVQFTKTPFPLIIAQNTSNTWQIEAPVENRRFARNGSPPSRIMWFQLPRALAGSELPPPWHWTPLGDSWRLENRRTGERLQGFVQMQPARVRQ
jgi:hypothetical protein